MRVIHTIGEITERSGGPSRSVTNLCSSIGRLGETVELVAGNDRFTDDRLIRPDTYNVQLHLVDAYRWGRLRYSPGFSRKLAELLREEDQPTLVHDHGIWGYNNITAWRAARRACVPYVLSPRGMLMPWALEFKASKKKLAWLLYQHRVFASAAVVVATSEQECETIKRRFARLPVAIIPNGVHISDPGSALSPKHHAGGGGTVLFMSRIHPVKNVIGLLRAWCLLPKDIAREWRLLIAGPNENGYAKEIVTHIRENGMQDCVELMGAVEERCKASVFESADVFILPSFTENFGLVVAEALSYGLPVVATTGTPWRELSRRGCGWWVPPNPESLSHALTQAMGSSSEQRCAMGAVGRDFIREQFSWPRIGAATIALYGWLTRQSVSRPNFVY